MVSKLTGGYRLIEAYITLLEETDSNQQQAAAAARQGMLRMSACYEEILKEKKWPFAHQTSLPDLL
jgi:hypothetical protein